MISRSESELIALEQRNRARRAGRSKARKPATDSKGAVRRKVASRKNAAKRPTAKGT